MHSSIALLAASLGVAAAETILINVGNGLFTFAPDSIQANVGDTLEFHFFNSLHTVVQGDFDTPCAMGTKKATGFNSGPIKNKADGGPNVFQVEVKDTKPIWFYCGTPTHCQAGMVGAVNAPDTGNTLDAYRTAAADTSSSESLPTVQGGCIVPEGTAPSSDCSAGGSSGSSSSEASSSELATSAPSSSSEAPSSSAESTGTSAAPTSASESGSITAVPTSTAAPPSKPSNATISATIVPANGGSVLGGKTALVSAVVVGLGFLVMLA